MRPEPIGAILTYLDLVGPQGAARPPPQLLSLIQPPFQAVTEAHAVERDAASIRQPETSASAVVRQPCVPSGIEVDGGRGL